MVRIVPDKVPDNDLAVTCPFFFDNIIYSLLSFS